MTQEIFKSAQSYFNAGLNVIPCRATEKRPVVAWAEYQQKKINPNVFFIWFRNNDNRIAIICGAVSGNLEMIDFDDAGSAYPRWRDLVGADLLAKLVIEQTPRGGIHVVYRCSNVVIPGNQKLAEKWFISGAEGAARERRVLIETRGEGGYFLCTPNAGYQLQQGELSKVNDITTEEREKLLWAARQLNEVTEVEKQAPQRVQHQTESTNESSPAEEFNSHNTFRDLLRKHGWKYTHSKGDNDYYRRPGKDSGEHSASVKNDEVLYVYSTNAAPFVPERGYSKFDAFACLEHSGDLRAASVAVLKSRPVENKYRAKLSGGSIPATVSNNVAPTPVAEIEETSGRGPLSSAKVAAIPEPVRVASAAQIDVVQKWRESLKHRKDEPEEREEFGIPQPIPIGGLLDFIPEEDSASILGNRWLCEGGSALLIGPAGIGKSTLTVQIGVQFSKGEDFFGLKPRGCLKSLYIQAENDDGDIAEMIQGVVRGMGYDVNNSDLRQHLKDQIVIVRESVRTGAEFCKVARRLIEIHKPDLVFADPLLSYVGGDLSRQEVCSQFLRNGLNPVIQETKVGWIWCHHTGKPPKDSKAFENWTDADYQYLGIGSSDLTNWARAICVIVKEHETEPVFKMMFAKRGKRAGLSDATGKPINSLILKHSTNGSTWELGELVPEKEEGPKVEYRSPQMTKDIEDKFERVLGALKMQPMRYTQAVKMAMSIFETSERTIKRMWGEFKKHGVGLNAEGLWTDTRGEW